MKFLLEDLMILLDHENPRISRVAALMIEEMKDSRR